MSLQIRLSALISTIKTETKALRTLISGTNNGSVIGLTTTATNLVDAVNEVKTTADAAAGGGTAINDATTNATDAWSGSKINTELTATQAAAVAQAKNEILDGAAAEVDTLVEIATSLAANESTDAALAATVANKANSSDIYTQAQLGNPETDLVALWNIA